MITGTVKHEVFRFPAGEKHVRLVGDYEVLSPNVKVKWVFENSEEIVELLLYANALKEAGFHVETLEIPYFPCARQDRVAVPGDAFALRVMCDLINSIRAKRVIVHDAHSYVLPALLENVVEISQASIFAPHVRKIRTDNEVVLIAPDAGALKKIYELASFVDGCEVVTAIKHRNPSTGEITDTQVLAKDHQLTGKVCILVDDICDGGRTFTEIAKVIRAHHHPKKIVLMVTHGLFTKGLGVFTGLIDEIYSGGEKMYELQNTVGVNRNLITTQSIMEERAV